MMCVIDFLFFILIFFFTGFVTSKVACCGQGPYNGIGLCTPLSNLCPNRDIYAFWDPFHPSERANRIIVQQIFTGSSKYMHPMNLSTVKAIMESRTWSKDQQHYFFVILAILFMCVNYWFFFFGVLIICLNLFYDVLCNVSQKLEC